MITLVIVVLIGKKKLNRLLKAWFESGLKLGYQMGSNYAKWHEVNLGLHDRLDSEIEEILRDKEGK